MKYSIVIPTYNRAYITTSVIYNFLHLLKNREKDYEIIVVNDGSHDETLSILSFIKSTTNDILRIINTNKDNNEYRNPGFARNAGIKYASGEIICFCDGDIIHLINPLQQMDKILQNINDKNSIYITGTYMRINHKGECSGPHGKNANIPHSSWLAVSKENLIKIGGYDERFKIYGNEDHDIVQRFERMGLHHISCDKIIGIHPLFDSGRDDNQQPEHIKKIQLEIQRENNIIRNENITWGNGVEYLLEQSTGTINWNNQLEQSTGTINWNNQLEQSNNLNKIQTSIKNIDNTLSILVNDSGKITKILNLCTNLNLSLVSHQDGLFIGKKQIKKNGLREVFQFIKFTEGDFFSDLSDYQSDSHISLNTLDSFDLIILGQLHRQRNIGNYLDLAFKKLKVGGELVVCCPFYSNCIGSGNTNNLWNAGTIVYNLILSGFDCKQAKISTFTNEIQIYLVKNNRKIPPSIALGSLYDFFPIETYQHFNGNILEVNWK